MFIIVHQVTCRTTIGRKDAKSTLTAGRFSGLSQCIKIIKSGSLADVYREINWSHQAVCKIFLLDRDRIRTRLKRMNCTMTWSTFTLRGRGVDAVWLIRPRLGLCYRELDPCRLTTDIS